MLALSFNTPTPIKKKNMPDKNSVCSCCHNRFKEFLPRVSLDVTMVGGGAKVRKIKQRDSKYAHETGKNSKPKMDSYREIHIRRKN